MDIISSNPYRLLGVYSNSPIKDRIANANKLKAYLKVGKSVDFPLDLSNLIPAPIRTVESMEHANACINLPHDQLKYALFWFIKVSSIDEMALGYLQNGNTDKAKELLEKKETFSSLINLGVLALIQKDKAVAIQTITKVIHNDDYRAAFVKAVCDETCQIAEDELARLFMDELLAEIPTQELMQLFLDNGTTERDNSYLKDKVVGEPIATINAEIAKAKSVKNNDAGAQYKAAISLMNSTKESLGIIKGLLEASDMQYQMVVDNLAKQILQCGINYYNSTNEEEYIKIDKAYKLQNYAYSIAVGKLVKDRCRENVAILVKQKRELPPATIKEYDKFIKDELAKYQALPKLIVHAIELIKKCTPYLMSIKEELGYKNSYYLKLSTLIVNVALCNVIEEFNRINNDSVQLDFLLDRENTVRRIRNVCKEAWIATLYMDKLDMEEDFRIQRYSQNRTSLKEQVLGIGISTSQTIQLERRSDSQMFKDCKSVSACRKYLEVFSNGKFVAEVKAKMEEYEFDVCVTTQDCSAFKKKHPNTQLPINKKWEDCYFNACKTIENYQGYLNAYPNGRFVSSARSRIEELVFKYCKNVNDYKLYLQKYPSGKYKSEVMQIIADEECWERCISSHSKDEYKNYLIQFPNGRHKTEAQQKIGKNSSSSGRESSWAALIISWLFVIAVITICVIFVLSN